MARNPERLHVLIQQVNFVVAGGTAARLVMLSDYQRPRCLISEARDNSAEDSPTERRVKTKPKLKI